MKALITGGTSGIGRAIAQELDNRGYELTIVAAHEVDQKVLSKYKKPVEFLKHDLTKEAEVYKLLEETASTDFDIFVDNAGFGDYRPFTDSSDDKEMDMIDLNCKATHLLLKHFLRRMHKKGRGRILVTASSAAFAASPYMATYYATKGYIFKLALGYYRELKDMKSPVTLSILCPGPVITNFEDRANVTFTIKALTAEKVGRTAVKNLFKGKTIIIPSIGMKFLHILSRISPEKLSLAIISKSAKRRQRYDKK